MTESITIKDSYKWNAFDLMEIKYYITLVLFILGDTTYYEKYQFYVQQEIWIYQKSPLNLDIEAFDIILQNSPLLKLDLRLNLIVERYIIIKYQVKIEKLEAVQIYEKSPNTSKNIFNNNTETLIRSM